MKWVLIFILLLILIVRVGSVTYDNCELYGNCKPIISTSIQNNTLNVNNSQYLQGLTPAGVANLYVETDPRWNGNSSNVPRLDGVNLFSNLNYFADQVYAFTGGVALWLDTTSDPPKIQSSSTRNILMTPSAITRGMWDYLYGLHIYGNLNVSQNITAQRYCNASNCYTIEQFLNDTTGGGSGGGNPFDQSLNTTDDVVFVSVNTSGVNYFGQSEFSNVINMNGNNIEEVQDLRANTIAGYSGTLTWSGNQDADSNTLSNVILSSVSGINLGDLDDADVSSVSSGEVLYYDGSYWTTDSDFYYDDTIYTLYVDFISPSSQSYVVIDYLEFNDGLSTGTLDVDTLTFSSSDPELTVDYNVTKDRALLLSRASVPPQKAGGLAHFYNGTAMVYWKPITCQYAYMIDDEKGWVKLSGDIRNAGDSGVCYNNDNYISEYKFDSFTGQVVPTQRPNPRNVIPPEFELNRSSGLISERTSSVEVST